MISNNPFFADLSTYSPEKTIPFYENVFRWKYYKRDNYYTAFLGTIEVVGLYETPEKFKQMRMPHFWMTYIKVACVDETINKAKMFGEIIEIDYEIKNFGKIALIRDPQGAGFTIYQGDKLKNVRTEKTANTIIWNELHVFDSSKIIPFYQGVFNWKIIKNEKGYYNVLNDKHEHIADIVEVLGTYMEKYKYWICTFGVEDLYKTKNQVLENGGNQIISEGNRILFTDNSNEAFFYLKEI
ncbi:VOC family protein [Aquimarina sp. Aq78]|uniref:VOC family protein n=1 Tax=Aquimarina sp. Aq78 TaxID=1191889 RepID=UPI000D10BEDB|nr:VOC family protein [Aquimarina sp. Aq78]